MDGQMLKELKSKARDLPAILRIGKNGVTDAIVAELKVHLKKRKLIKVKFLRSVLDYHNKKELAALLVEKTEAELVGMQGFTVVLYKK